MRKVVINIDGEAYVKVSSIQGAELTKEAICLFLKRGRVLAQFRQNRNTKVQEIDGINYAIHNATNIRYGQRD